MNLSQSNATNTNVESVLATNKVIRNTYLLLSMTLIFSAVTAVASMAMNMGIMTNLASSGIALLLMWFVLPRTANSGAGVGVVFAITGLLGFGLGPILNHYLAMQNGGQLIATAAGGTGIIFMALSAYALTTRKDFSFMGGFLMVGLIVAIVASLANIFMGIPALSLAISAAVIMIMSGLILYDTSRMIHDPNANYVMMTVGLFLSILNIFTSLLHILGAFSGDD
ncbi:BAX inhibitor protein [Solemya pervernicosa gill symbiont]|uniref:BAX inhibitor protein n=2 Tax=Gammaproteobacteria incertae sedis TaxID=118884 RepID=A0A1T2L6H5_9GAMM|nr:Bax inhibitor-1/YccA family protein [Candidatus Reidiella endopervernicosa]OOZ40708.1 BAX inhibitor protein [Solemya pervernicosa gill symbiont]QKQ26776.1 Bax inhibitor-1/YccA family protein [Candidatus Reidiella endopervernicosa]